MSSCGGVRQQCVATKDWELAKTRYDDDARLLRYALIAAIHIGGRMFILGF